MILKYLSSQGRHWARLIPGCGLALLLTYTAITASATDINGALVLTAKADSATTIGELLDPQCQVWKTIPDQRMHLNRTPPLYLGDPVADDAPPTTTVKLARIAGGTVVLRMHWSDPSMDQAGSGTRFEDTGDPDIYRRQTENTSAFADAFCAMVPLSRGPTTQYPSLMMGEQERPVELYFWRAGNGFQMLTGHGRSTTALPTASAKGPAPTAPQGEAIHEGEGWTITLAISNMTPGTPICLAIWDGAKKQRDGLKYFSLWYEVH